MIEEALLKHLKAQIELSECLTTYCGEPAIFSQEAPADTDSGWAGGPQYGRIVFAEDLQGDPERTMGGILAVDILLSESEDEACFPEDIEPIIRKLIHGYFFSNGTFTVAAQWKNSSYFTQQTDRVNGCTVTFDLLAFPVLTTSGLDVVARLNEWTAGMSGVYVINYTELPDTAWKPSGAERAVYWRRVNDRPAGWIPDTYQTIWRTATIRGHIFAEDIASSSDLAQMLITRLYAIKRLRKDGTSPIMVNRRNTQDDGADPLRTGQVTVEATYGVIIHHGSEDVLNHINFDRKESTE